MTSDRHLGISPLPALFPAPHTALSQHVREETRENLCREAGGKHIKVITAHNLNKILSPLIAPKECERLLEIPNVKISGFIGAIFG